MIPRKFTSYLCPLPKLELAGFEAATATLVTSWDFYAATASTRSFGPPDAYSEQMRLTYTRDAWSFALALEDPDYDTSGRFAIH